MLIPPTLRGPVRRSVASAGALVATLGILALPWPLAIRLVPALTLAASAALVHSRNLGTHILLRSVWLATAIGFAFNASYAYRGQMAASFATALTALASLVVMGGHRLGADGEVDVGAFRPSSHRSALIAALSIAGAGALSLAYFGLIWWRFLGTMSLAVPLAGLLAASCVGMYRLRTWALLLNASVVTAVGALALSETLPVPPPLLSVYALSSAAQLLLLSPWLRGVFRQLRGAPPPAELATTELRIALPVGPASAAVFEAEREAIADAEASRLVDHACPAPPALGTLK